LLFPSWLEGFGLPLLEAMASGTPVVTSGASAMPEVAGPAAVYVDPSSPHGIASAVDALIADPQHRQRLIELGRSRVARFSWDRAAAATAQVLRQAAGLASTGDDEYRV
jgi:alpha-1,3-rhamnosyl/mannosyltransferase